MLGPGEYDDICTEVRKKTKADGVILAVFKGFKGKDSGFSVQAPKEILLNLPTILRGLAESIESDMKDGNL